MNVYAFNSVCEDLAGKELSRHLMAAEMRYGETEALNNKAVSDMLNCLSSHQVCMVGASEHDSEIKLWSSESINDVMKNDNSSDSSFIFSAMQSSRSDNEKWCVVGSRLLVNAIPWIVKGWRKENGSVIKNSKLNYYATYKMGMTPFKMFDSLLKSYDTWKKKHR